jgi:NAD-dependent dihydropyrimidine dehydrogenase PreA subunit
MAYTPAKAKREIIKIDEEKCNGCGQCVIACAEGALQIINGKAKLISETYCDGLGACIGECPQGALIIEERESSEFDDKAVEHHLKENEQPKANLPCGCPSHTVTQFEKQKPKVAVTEDTVPCESELSHWPVQLKLVPPTAPFLHGTDLMFVADCVPFAYAAFHRDFVKGHTILVACPKLDDFDAHLAKLTEILLHADLTSLTVLHMEVPCCSGLVYMAKQAIEASGKQIPFNDITIGVRGNLVTNKKSEHC